MGENGYHPNEVCSLVNYCINVNCLVLTDAAQLRKILTLGRGEEEHRGTLWVSATSPQI